MTTAHPIDIGDRVLVNFGSTHTEAVVTSHDYEDGRPVYDLIDAYGRERWCYVEQAEAVANA